MVTAVDELPATDDHVDAAIAMLAPWGDGDIAAAVGRLSPSQQQIVTLRYVEDAPLDLIAARSGTSVSAVSQRLATIHRRVALELAA